MMRMTGSAPTRAGMRAVTGGSSMRRIVDEKYQSRRTMGYLYRAIDQFGQVIDVLASEKRD